MDMVSSIASASIGLSSSRVQTEISVALADKVLDTAKEQGDILQQMMETAAPDTHLLDVLA